MIIATESDNYNDDNNHNDNNNDNDNYNNRIIIIIIRKEQ